MEYKLIILYFSIYAICSVHPEITSPRTEDVSSTILKEETDITSENEATEAYDVVFQSDSKSILNVLVPIEQPKAWDLPGMLKEFSENSTSFDSNGMPLRILGMRERKFTLMKDELEQILMRDDVKDNHVAIISIAGAFRGGKSFMLDYFLRYLQATPEQRADGRWLGDKDQPLRGFSWRGGSERNTLGVLMWSEPYYVTLERGEKITVLLVDTQGIFDNDSTIGDCSTIFAFSTLISSLILFNVKENIKEDDLNHLHLFSEFGELVTSDNGKVYQNLEFLVRDFPYPFETPYGLEGGQTLVHKRLEIKKNQAPELRKVREDLLASYEDITAFLMPHPGYAVLNPKYDGRWSDLDKDFKMYLQVLVDSIFGPKNITPRKIGGNVITGKDLFEYIKSFMEAFESDDMPTLQTIAKVTTEAALRLASREAYDYYKTRMESEVGEAQPSLPGPALLSIHEKAKNECLNLFLSKKTMSSDEDQKPYLIRLQQDLDNQLNNYGLINGIKEKNLTKEAEEAYNAVIKNVHKDKPLCLAIPDLNQVHQEAVKAGEKVFNSKRRNFDDILDEQKMSFLKSLDNNYHELYAINNVNNIYAVNSIVLEYNTEMEKHINIDPPISTTEFENIHQKQYEKAKKDLNAKRNRASSFDADSYTRKLSQEISLNYRKYKNVNKKSNVDAIQKNFFYYTNQMQWYWDSDDSDRICVPPAIFEKQHEVSEEQALNMFRGTECWDDECELLKRKINSHYYGLKEENNNANERFVSKAYHIYTNYMDEKTAFSGWWIAGFGIPYLVNKVNRGDYHNEAKQKAYRYFHDHRTSTSRDIYWNDLTWRMEYAYQNYYN